MAMKPMKKPVAKKTTVKPKASPVMRTSVGQRQAKDKKGSENVSSFYSDSSWITGAPMLDQKGWAKDVNTVAQMAKKYKLANTDKQARDVALKALKGWETQVEKKVKSRTKGR